jgi:hypothetical protein
MIKEMVTRDITLFQMQQKKKKKKGKKKLKSDFGIFHVNISLDFSFE